MNGGFFEAVYAAVATVPYGKVATYGDIARAPIRRALLEQEGIPFRADGRVDLEICRIKIA